MADTLKSLADLDGELFELVKRSEELAFSEGKIPLKYKFLIAMAIDACMGAEEGVKVLVKAAMENGATKEEVSEALRIAVYIAGAGAAYTAAKGLKDLNI